MTHTEHNTWIQDQGFKLDTSGKLVNDDDIDRSFNYANNSGIIVRGQYFRTEHTVGADYAEEGAKLFGLFTQIFLHLINRYLLKHTYS